MFTGKTSHVGGEKEQKEHKLAEDSADGLKKKFHDLKVCDVQAVEVANELSQTLPHVIKLISGVGGSNSYEA